MVDMVSGHLTNSLKLIRLSAGFLDRVLPAQVPEKSTKLRQSRGQLSSQPLDGLGILSIGCI
jgi:hypothetical protein